jgi:phosphoglycolate phosphatase
VCSHSKELIKVSFLEDETVIKILRVAAYMYSQFKTYKESSGIYPQSDKVIKYIAAKGKKVALLSNNLRASVEESLSKFSLKQYFVEILGANDTEKLKPEPDGLLKIMKDQGITNPKRTLFIGDMKTDVQAGKAAGVKTLCVASGLNKKEELIMEKPDFIVDDIPAFAKMIGAIA